MCQVGLAGPVPAASVEVLRSRFEDITLSTGGGLTLLEGRVADQAALRALLGLLWDVGSEIRSVRVTPDR